MTTVPGSRSCAVQRCQPALIVGLRCAGGALSAYPPWTSCDTCSPQPQKIGSRHQAGRARARGRGQPLHPQPGAIAFDRRVFIGSGQADQSRAAPEAVHGRVPIVNQAEAEPRAGILEFAEFHPPGSAATPSPSQLPSPSTA